MGSPYVEYMEHAKLALIIKDTLFVGQNSNVDTGCTDDTPNDIARIKETNVNEWFHKLNIFAKNEIYDCITSTDKIQHLGHLQCHMTKIIQCYDNILQYGMGWLPRNG